MSQEAIESHFVSKPTNQQKFQSMLLPQQYKAEGTTLQRISQILKTGPFTLHNCVNELMKTPS